MVCAFRVQLVVSIAFRLSDELGPRRRRGRQPLRPPRVSIAFRLSDELGPAPSTTIRPRKPRSQLPFGFRTNWDTFSLRAQSTTRPRVSIAFRLSDELGPSPSARKETHDRQVSIAFRLSDELGLQDLQEDTLEKARVSIAFRLSDELGRAIVISLSSVGASSLNCLSAFGRIGTRVRPRQVRERGDQVSIAFRLSDELGLFENTTSLPRRWRCLNCLSAFGRIGTCS